jgi:tape measure domain-containing protein
MAALTFKVGGDTTGLGRAVSKAKGMLSGLGSAAKNLAIGGAVTGSVAAIGAAFRGVKLAADMEQVAVAMEVMTGSAEKGNRAIEALMEFSNSTPLKPDEVVSAGRALIAFGTEADEVVDVLKKVGNVAAGIGAPLGEIAEIYGKAQVSGRLFGEDINQLAGRGIPIQEELAKVLGVSTSSIKQLVSEGKVGFPELEKAFTNMSSSGGKFAGMLNKQSKTFSGVFSTLTGKLDGLLMDVGKGLMESLKPVLEELVDFVDKSSDGAKQLGENIAKVVTIIVTAFKTETFGELVKQSLLFAGKSLVNFVIEGFAMAGVVLMESVKAVGAMLNEIFSFENLKAVGNQAALNVFKGGKFVADTGMFPMLSGGLKIVGDENIDDIEDSLEQGAANGAEHLSGFGDRMSDRFSDVMQTVRDNVAAMGRLLDGSDILGAAKNKKLIDDIIKDLNDAADELNGNKKDTFKDPFDDPFHHPSSADDPKTEPNKKEEDSFSFKVLKPIVSSLGRIGGDGNRGQTVIFRMDKERNKLLKDIAFNTGNGQTAVYV